MPANPADNISVSWSEDEAHPQTCVTCHDPHAIGTTSGNNTNATVRISGDTPLLVAGFQAFGVGKGAMCMTCHNTRRGLRNDATWPTTTDRDRAPHGGVQADLVMGQNAYFVTVGNRGAHSFVSDTCVTCHMKATPPPDVLSYNQGGTNHTFFASEEVCIECHTGGEPNAAGIQAAIGGPLHQLEGLITDYYGALIDGLLAAGNQIDLNGQATITNPSQILAIHLSETRGRQALVFELDSGDVGPVRLTTIDITVGPDAGTTLFGHTGEAGVEGDLELPAGPHRQERRCAQSRILVCYSDGGHRPVLTAGSRTTACGESAAGTDREVENLPNPCRRPAGEGEVQEHSNVRVI